MTDQQPLILDEGDGNDDDDDDYYSSQHEDEKTITTTTTTTSVGIKLVLTLILVLHCQVINCNDTLSTLDKAVAAASSKLQDQE